MRPHQVQTNHRQSHPGPTADDNIELVEQQGAM